MIYLICREPCLSNFNRIFQKGTDGTNEVDKLENDNLTLRSGMHFHVTCSKNYIRTPGGPSSSAEDYYRKTRTLSGAFNIRKDCFYCGCVITEREWKTKKSCNISHKKREVNKAVHEGIFGKKDDEWSIEVKERYACLCEDAVYHIECSSSFQSSNGNPKKNIMWRKCGRDTTVDKERRFLKTVEHINSDSDEQFHITILGKMMEEKSSGNNFCLDYG